MYMGYRLQVDNNVNLAVWYHLLSIAYYYLSTTTFNLNEEVQNIILSISLTRVETTYVAELMPGTNMSSDG